jgi:diguanylate cyclase (GGDEF)-like protein
MPVEWPRIAYPFALLASIAVSLMLASYAWRSRRERGAIPFVITALCEAAWAVMSMLEVLTDDPSVKVFWTNMLFLAYTILPVAWLAMTLQYANLDRWLTKNAIFLLSIVPAITLALVWSNPWHGAVYSQVAVHPADMFTVVSATYGPWFYAHSVYSYALLTISIAILISCQFQSNRFQRGQARILLAGTLLPLVWNIAYVLKLSPFSDFDLTPVVLGLSGIIVSWGLFRWHLFDILPVARDMVVQNMSDALFVLDARRRVVDYNPAAERLLRISGQSAMGASCDTLVGMHPELAKICQAQEQDHFEIIFGDGPDSRHYEALVSRLDGMPGRPSGRILLLHDVTERKQAETALSYAAQHDPLTGVYNRAFFDAELRRLEDSQAHPIAAVVLDLDGLKATNEAAGRRAGDKMLCVLGDILRASFRRGDLIARVGGDEFAILMPRTDKPGAEEVCRRLEANVESHNASRTEPKLEISFGVEATSDQSRSLERVMMEAGANMYRQKLRSRVSSRHHLVDTLLATLAMKDYVQQGHIERVSDMALALGKAAGISRDEMADLALLAEVHDLGKVGIPDYVLQKTGPLTAAERGQLEEHPDIGANIAAASPELAHIAELIRHHHEWWSGGGYPGGWRGAQIPVACRVLAIVDAYDAMTSERPYRAASSVSEALREITQMAGVQFDPRLAALFVARRRQGAILDQTSG